MTQNVIQHKVTVYHDESGKPVQVMMAWEEYQTLLGNRQRPSRLIDGGRIINLPNGGPDGFLDVAKLIRKWNRFGIIATPINARAKRFNEFEPEECMTIEYMVREELKNTNTSYINTMQVTLEVQLALIETGLFKECRLTGTSYRKGATYHRRTRIFGRSVKGLELNDEAAAKFLELHN